MIQCSQNRRMQLKLSCSLRRIALEPYYSKHEKFMFMLGAMPLESRKDKRDTAACAHTHTHTTLLQTPLSPHRTPFQGCASAKLHVISRFAFLNLPKRFRVFSFATPDPLKALHPIVQPNLSRQSLPAAALTSCFESFY